MTTYKVISTLYSSGYSLASKYGGLIITTSGEIDGSGLKLNNAAGVANYGTIFANGNLSNANNGISAFAGTTIKNGSAVNHSAYIRGYSGIFAQSASVPATVTNFGTIFGDGPGGDGVFIVGGGAVTNASGGRILGVHSGIAAGALATVFNYGSIFGDNVQNTGAEGVDLGDGGTVINGSAADVTAYILGQSGAGVLSSTASATITNFGAIVSSTANGVELVAGGTITNGASGSTIASIVGHLEGVRALGAAKVINFATIRGPADSGVLLGAGGVVTNGAATDKAATIYGEYRGVVVNGAAGMVTNFGAIEADLGVDSEGVDLSQGGKVVNGSTAVTTAEIYGGHGAGVFAGAAASAAIANFGTIKSKSGYGVDLTGGGAVTNGASTSTTATISGYYIGVLANGTTTVSNFATILALATNITVPAFGVDLQNGGAVNNGSAASTAADIAGHAAGVVIAGKAGTVTNFGHIGIFAYTTGTGVRLAAGGTVNNFGTVEAGTAVTAYNAAAMVVNGSNTDRTALLTGGGGGVILNGGGTVLNYGTIAVAGSQAAVAMTGGPLVNGSTTDLTALIRGRVFSSGTVTNFATITDGPISANAVYVAAGRLTNGSASITSALISGGGGGVYAAKGASVANYATIDGGSGTGVVLTAGCTFLIGAAGMRGALTEGATGVSATGASATIDNFGVIYGSGGVAIAMTGAGDLLQVEAGCAFYGAVLGGGGTLVLNSGSGTISGFAHGDATVSGAITPAGFANFGVFEIAAPASFTLAGPGNLTSGRTLVVDGKLTLADTLASAGALTVARTLTGTGTLALTAGTATFQPGAVLTVAKVTQSGGAASFTAASLTVSHPWTQSAGTVTVSAGDKVSFTGAGDSFSGTLGGAGTIAFTGGSDTLLHPTLAATSMVVNGAEVTLSGAVTLTKTLTVTATNFTIAAAGATLSGGGTLALTNAATNAVKGAAPTAALTNLDKITGAGTISSLVLVNQAGGTINANLSSALVINTGTATVANAGLIESTSTGGVTIKSAVANTGTLTVIKGTLDVTGAVSGTGVVRIGGGVADFGSTFTQNVTFTSTTGVLELAKATAYTGTITGFSKSGTTSLDLLNIGFTSGTTKATYSGTTASGVLTVTDGTHTAKIHLTGNYTASTFDVSSDGHGGTSVVDPTGRTLPLQPLVTAMAGFGAKPGAVAGHTALVPRAAWTTLAHPA